MHNTFFIVSLVRRYLVPTLCGSAVFVDKTLKCYNFGHDLGRQMKIYCHNAAVKKKKSNWYSPPPAEVAKNLLVNLLIVNSLGKKKNFLCAQHHEI